MLAGAGLQQAGDPCLCQPLIQVTAVQVCMFDSSIVRKGLAKYCEAMLGGCMVAADVPLEMEAVLRPAMIVLNHMSCPCQPLIQVTAVQVCMFDSSIVRKGLAKYFEAMMGGCVVAADVPLEMEAVVRPAMIVLEQKDDMATIVAKVPPDADCPQLQNSAAPQM